MNGFDLPSPTEDLLDWCTKITNDFYGLNITDLSLSWKNGIAFCAIIHHFRPDLIDYYSLDAEDAKTNLQKAFDAASKLGISLASPEEMLILDVPDKLSVITSLHQLRAYFKGRKLNNGTSSNSLDDSDEDDNSLLGFEWSGPKKSDFRHIFSKKDDEPLVYNNHTPTSASNTFKDQDIDIENIPKKSSDISTSNNQPDGKIIFSNLTHHSKDSVTGKKNSDQTILINDSDSKPLSVSNRPKRPHLMTHKQLTNPLDFDSDDEELGLNISHSK